MHACPYRTAVDTRCAVAVAVTIVALSLALCGCGLNDPVADVPGLDDELSGIATGVTFLLQDDVRALLEDELSGSTIEVYFDDDGPIWGGGDIVDDEPPVRTLGFPAVLDGWYDAVVAAFPHIDGILEQAGIARPSSDDDLFGTNGFFTVWARLLYYAVGSYQDGFGRWDASRICDPRRVAVTLRDVSIQLVDQTLEIDAVLAAPELDTDNICLYEVDEETGAILDTHAIPDLSFALPSLEIPVHVSLTLLQDEWFYVWPTREYCWGNHVIDVAEFLYGDDVPVADPPVPHSYDFSGVRMSTTAEIPSLEGLEDEIEIDFSSRPLETMYELSRTLARLGAAITAISSVVTTSSLSVLAPTVTAVADAGGPDVADCSNVDDIIAALPDPFTLTCASDVWFRNDWAAVRARFSDSALIVDAVYDDDGDGLITGTDNCPDIANRSQDDSDYDGIGDPCDTEQNMTTAEVEAAFDAWEELWIPGLCYQWVLDSTRLELDQRRFEGMLDDVLLESTRDPHIEIYLAGRQSLVQYWEDYYRDHGTVFDPTKPDEFDGLALRRAVNQALALAARRTGNPWYRRVRAQVDPERPEVVHLVMDAATRRGLGGAERSLLKYVQPPGEVLVR